MINIMSQEKGFQPEISSVLHDVFQACDNDNTGKVRVSKLISFLKEKATAIEIYEYLNELTWLLDIDGTDPSIGWSTCENGIHEWIKRVNNGSMPCSENRFNRSPMKNIRSNSSPVKSPKYSNPSFINENKGISLASTYSNDSMDTSELSWDNSDIQLRLEELEITNKRIVEDNLKLKNHLNFTEDQNSSILQENDQLRSQLTKYEKCVEESRLVAKSYEELKATVAEYHTFKNDLVEKTCMLEKENFSLQKALNEYETKISQLDTSIDGLRLDKEKLTKELKEQSQLINQIDEISISREELVEDAANKSDYMSSVIAEVSLANEVLKAQKRNLENELSDLRQEICSISMFQKFEGIQSTPLNQNSKYEGFPQSLHQELRAEMNGSPVSFDGSLLYSKYHDLSDISETSSVCSNSPGKERFTSFAQKCRVKFKEKREFILEKIEEFANNESNKDEGKSSLVLEELKMEFESFTEKIAELAQDKRIAEKRALKMATQLKKLEEDNKFLEESRDKAVLKFGNLSISFMELEERKEELLQKLSAKENCINTLKEELEELTSQSLAGKIVEEEKQNEACEQIGNLKIRIESLQAKNTELQRNVFDLEEMMSSKGELLLRAENDLKCTENLLNDIKIKYEEDLRELITVIPNHTSKINGVQKISCGVVKDTLLQFVMNSKHQQNKLLGVRESPDGGSHSLEISSVLDDHYEDHTRKERFPHVIRKENEQLVSVQVHQEDNYTQTDLDLSMMNKLLESYGLIPPSSIEPNIPERLQKHSSVHIPEIIRENRFSNGRMDSASEYDSNFQCFEQCNHEEEEKENSLLECIRNDILPNIINNVVKEVSENESIESNLKRIEQIPFIEEHVLDSSISRPLYFGCSSTPPLISVNDERAENDERETPCQLEPVNPKIANIIEFDRSDMSSDSESELHQRRRASSKRIRHSLNKRSKSAPEFDRFAENEAISTDLNNNSKLKQRRVGVSAEPVRVSWSTLRESYKQKQQQQQIDDAKTDNYIGSSPSEENFENEHNSDSTNEEGQSVSSQEIANEVATCQDTPTSSSILPTIEVQEEVKSENTTELEANNLPSESPSIDSSTDKSSNVNELVSKKHSLQVPEISCGKSILPKPSFVNSICPIPDEELGKKFNNVVFTFHTDQFTLQKRLENQERARDVAEASMDKEIAKLSATILDLRRIQNGTQEFEEACGILHKQSEVLQKAAMKISAQSEQHGSYQQESNTAPNIEVMINYVDLLRRNLEKISDEYIKCRERLQCFENMSSGCSDAENPSAPVENETLISNATPKHEGLNINTEQERSPRPSFSSITKSLLLTQGIAKLRKNRRNALNIPTPLTKKRVSFGETKMFTESSFNEAEIKCDSISSVATPGEIKETGLKILIVAAITLLLYAFLSMVFRSLEIDTYRLYDKILQYIPHTVEHKTDKNSS